MSPREIAAAMTRLTGRRLRLLRLGGVGALSTLITVAQMPMPATPSPFPIWQGMHDLRDMMSRRGRLEPLDNCRYGSIDWSVVLREAFVKWTTCQE